MPKFKVGDKIIPRYDDDRLEIETITNVKLQDYIFSNYSRDLHGTDIYYRLATKVEILLYG